MKPTYSSLLTKEDKQFLAHAKKVLGFDYQMVMQDAQEAYEAHARASIAKREANLVILAALKQIGQEHWRESKEEKPVERILTQPATLPQRKSGKKWEGKTIEQMMDENLKRMRGNSTI